MIQQAGTVTTGRDIKRYFQRIQNGKVKVDRYWLDCNDRQFFETAEHRTFFQTPNGDYLEMAVSTSSSQVKGRQQARHSPDWYTQASDRPYSPEQLMHVKNHRDIERIRGVAERGGKLRRNSRFYRLTRYLKETGYSGPSIDLGDVFSSLDSDSRRDWKRLLETHRSANNSKSLRVQNGSLSLEELVTPQTLERWHYMDAIQRGRVQYKRHDFHTESYLNINQKGNWFITGPNFHQINPLTLETKMAIASRRFLEGDYLLYTEHGRYFHGRNDTLIGELNPQTLQLIPNQFYPIYGIKGIRREGRMANGKTEKEPPEGKILLRNKNDLYTAMWDITEGFATVSNYQPTKSNQYMMEVLSWVQKKVESIGTELTTAYVEGIIANDILHSVLHLKSSGEADGGYINHPPHLRWRNHINYTKITDGQPNIRYKVGSERVPATASERVLVGYSPITGQRS